jgi:hypothetical protein
MSATIKGLGFLYGTENSVQGANLAIITKASFTPRYGGPAQEVENDQGLVKAFALVEDGGDIDLDVVYESNSTTTNLSALAVGSLVKCQFPAVNSGNNINTTVAALPTVNRARKAETSLSFKLLYRPNAVA